MSRASKQIKKELSARPLPPNVHIKLPAAERGAQIAAEQVKRYGEVRKAPKPKIKKRRD